MTVEQMKLEDILSDKPAPAPEPAAPAATAEPAPAPPEALAEKAISRKQAMRDKEQAAHGRVRDPETGQYAPKVEPLVEKAPEAPSVPAAPPEQEMTAKEKAAFAKAADETRKRQEFERENAELKARLQQPSPQPAAPQGEAKTFWDDPQAALAQSEARTLELVTKTRLNTSESIARSRHTDFDEKVSIFNDMVKSAPWLYNQMINAQDPAEFVYRAGYRQKQLLDAGGIEKLTEKIEKETRVKVEAELRDQLKKEQDARKAEIAALPGSLSNVTGSSPSIRPTWNGPTSLDNILKG